MASGSIINSAMSKSVNPAPEVGMGATKLCWSDRHAYTVIWVSESGKTIKVQRDRAIRLDRNGMSESQRYAFLLDPDGAVVTLRLTKRGWSHKRELFALGYREEYYDYSF